jgi:hypothetical protein
VPEGTLGARHPLCYTERIGGDVVSTPRRKSTHKIAIGDSDPINVRFAQFADSSRTFPKVREVPTHITSSEQMQQIAPLFDHLVGERE